jgi:hypothetical protein
MDIHVTVMKGHLILALFTAALIHNQAVKASPTHAHAQTSSSSLLRSVNSSLATYDCQGEFSTDAYNIPRSLSAMSNSAQEVRSKRDVFVTACLVVQDVLQA